MDTILLEIKRAIDARLYYLAVVMALTLPDICAALESQDGETTKEKYKAWYNANLATKYPNLKAVDCYRLRCGVVHQGRLGHPEMHYGRVIFTIPNNQQIVIHNNIMDDALNLDAVQFCKDVIASVEKWFLNEGQKPLVQTNLANLVQLRPQGLSPYIVGVPLIA